MTREEAIEELKGLKYDAYYDEEREALDVAIQALEQEPVIDKIRAEIEQQYKWLLSAETTTYNIDIAFDAIRKAVRDEAEQEPKISLEVYKQVAKERDIAIEQLHELGYEFGEKIEPTTKNCESCRYYGSHHEVCNYCYECSLWTEKELTTKNDLAVDCISRKAAEDITWQDPSYTDPLNVLTEVRDKIRNLPSVTPQDPKTGYISIDDVMSVFDDFMCGEVDEEDTETFLEMLKDKAESEEVDG